MACPQAAPGNSGYSPPLQAGGPLCRGPWGWLFKHLPHLHIPHSKAVQSLVGLLGPIQKGWGPPLNTWWLPASTPIPGNRQNSWLLGVCVCCSLGLWYCWGLPPLLYLSTLTPSLIPWGGSWGIWLPSRAGGRVLAPVWVPRALGVRVAHTLSLVPEFAASSEKEDPLCWPSAFLFFSPLSCPCPPSLAELASVSQQPRQWEGSSARITRCPCPQSRSCAHKRLRLFLSPWLLPEQTEKTKRPEKTTDSVPLAAPWREP